MRQLTPAQIAALKMLATGPAYKVTSGWAQAGRLGRIRVAVMGALIHAGAATTTTINGKLAAAITAAGRAAIEERKSA